MSSVAALPRWHLRLRAAALGGAQQVAAWRTVAGPGGRQQPPARAHPAAFGFGSGRLAGPGGGSSCRPLLPAGLALGAGGAQRRGGAACGAAAGRGRMASSTPLDGMDLFGEDGKGARTVVESYTPEGFIINRTFVEGATILLPEMVLHWNVREMHDLTVDSISIVRLLSKKPEILLLGTGRRIQRLPDAVQVQFKRMGLNVEVMDSVNAVATFNVLNQEGRQVVAALLPLEGGPKEESKEDADDILKDMPRPEMRSPGARPKRGSGPGEKKKGLSAGGGRPGGEARPGDPRF